MSGPITPTVPAVVKADEKAPVPAPLRSEPTVYPKCAHHTLKIDAKQLTRGETRLLRELNEVCQAVSPIYWEQCSPWGLEMRDFLRDVLKVLPPGKMRDDVEKHWEAVVVFCGPYDQSEIVSDYKKLTPNFTYTELKAAIEDAWEKRNDRNPQLIWKDYLIDKLDNIRAALFEIVEDPVRPPTVNLYDKRITKGMLETFKKHAELWAAVKKDRGDVVAYLFSHTNLITMNDAFANDQKLIDLINAHCPELLKVGSYGMGNITDLLLACSRDADTWKLVESPYTVVKHVDGNVVAVPFVEEYAQHIRTAARHMRESAKMLDDVIKEYDATTMEHYDLAASLYERYQDEVSSGKSPLEAYAQIKVVLGTLNPDTAPKIEKCFDVLIRQEYYTKFKEYLRARADAIEKTVYDKDPDPHSLYETDKMWVKVMQHPGFKVGVIVGPIEDGYIGMHFPDGFPAKTAYESTIFVLDEEKAEGLKKFQGVTARIAESLDVPEGHKRFGKMPFTVPINKVYAKGESETLTSIGVNLPNPKEIAETVGSVSAIFVNATMGKCEVFMVPISQAVIDKPPTLEEIRKYMEWYVMNHETGHPMGGYKDSKVELSKVLDAKYAQRTEEMKADTVAMRGLSISLTREEKEVAYRVMVADMLRLIYAGTPTYRDSCLVQFNYYAGEGAITKTGDGKLAVDVEKFDAAIDKLLKRLLRTEYDGRKNLARDLFSEYRDSPRAISLVKRDAEHGEFVIEGKGTPAAKNLVRRLRRVEEREGSEAAMAVYYRYLERARFLNEVLDQLKEVPKEVHFEYPGV